MTHRARHNAIANVLHNSKAFSDLTTLGISQLADEIAEAIAKADAQQDTFNSQADIVAGRLARRPKLLWEVLLTLRDATPFAGPWQNVPGGGLRRERSPFIPEMVGQHPASTGQAIGSGTVGWTAYANHKNQTASVANSIQEAQRAADDYLRKHGFMLVPGPLDPDSA